jgi:probable addiction module antidote protein
LEDGGVEEFLYALREVAIAQGGIQNVAVDSQFGRESLYKSLLRQGNPRLKTVDSVLRLRGLRIAITSDETAEEHHSKSAISSQ